ncbi:MAG: hypothetical protein KKA19_07760, partial [Candidatus Margulisbacteria bacterium]|nr:hypothetical protein [Candidatus Margulisiibacteriota bacterium]
MGYTTNPEQSVGLGTTYIPKGTINCSEYAGALKNKVIEAPTSELGKDYSADIGEIEAPQDPKKFETELFKNKKAEISIEDAVSIENNQHTFTKALNVSRILPPEAYTAWLNKNAASLSENVHTLLKIENKAYWTIEKFNTKNYFVGNKGNYEFYSGQIAGSKTRIQNTKVVNEDKGNVGGGNEQNNFDNMDTYNFKMWFDKAYQKIKALWPNASVRFYITGGDEIKIMIEFPDTPPDNFDENIIRIIEKEINPEINKETVTFKKKDFPGKKEKFYNRHLARARALSVDPKYKNSVKIGTDFIEMPWGEVQAYYRKVLIDPVAYRNPANPASNKFFKFLLDNNYITEEEYHSTEPFETKFILEDLNDAHFKFLTETTGFMRLLTGPSETIVIHSIPFNPALNEIINSQILLSQNLNDLAEAHRRFTDHVEKYSSEADDVVSHLKVHEQTENVKVFSEKEFNHTRELLSQKGEAGATPQETPLKRAEYYNGDYFKNNPDLKYPDSRNISAQPKIKTTKEAEPAQTQTPKNYVPKIVNYNSQTLANTANTLINMQGPILFITHIGPDADAYALIGLA